jgi:Lon protease-like protein
MRGSFALPLFPLESNVLLPGQRLALGESTSMTAAVLERARDFGDAVVASLVDGDSVHEIGVTAMVSGCKEEAPELCGIARCRLLSVRPDGVPIVTVQSYPEVAPAGARAESTTRLLRACYLRYCERFGREVKLPQNDDDLSALTWELTAQLGLGADQQQGFLVVPDAWTRGRLLLAAIRELELKERFLRPWAWLRSAAQWN